MGKENELLEAARTGNIQNIERLLCYKSRKSTGPLNALASFRKNVNVNCIDTSGGTPLHLASLNGHRAAVELLLNNEANPNATDSRGCTSLHLAAWNGFSDICRALLTKGPAAALVNTQNSDGDTPLHSASQYGHCAAVAVLLENHADPSIRNLREESPLDLAAQYGRVETVQLLLRSRPELIHRVHLDKFPLHLAARNGHRQVVELLLDAGVNINTKVSSQTLRSNSNAVFSDGNLNQYAEVVSKTAGTALHEAAFFCKLDVVKLLLERGIDVTETDPQGQTALDLINSYRSQKYNQVSSLIIEFLEHGNRYADAKKTESYYNSPSCRYSSAKEAGVVTNNATPSGLDSGGGPSQDGKVSDIYSQPVRRRRKPPPPVPENASDELPPTPSPPPLPPPDIEPLVDEGSETQDTQQSPPKEESPPPIPPRSPTLLKNLWQSTKFETMQEDNRSVGSVESIPGTLAHVQSVDATMTGRTSPQDMPRKPPRRRHPSPKINPDGKGSDSPSSLTQSYDGSSPLPEQSHSPYSIINPDTVFHSPYECRPSARDSDSHGNTEVVVMLNYESEPRSGVAGQKNAAALAEREGIAGGLPMRSGRTGCIREKPPLDHSLSHPHSTRSLKREKRKHRSESEAATEISYAEIQKPIMVVVDSKEGELCNRSSRNITRVEVKTTPVKTTPVKVEVKDLSMGATTTGGHIVEEKCRSESFSRRTPDPPSPQPHQPPPHQPPLQKQAHVTSTTSNMLSVDVPITTEFMDDEAANDDENLEEVSMSESKSFLEEVTKEQVTSEEDQRNDSEVASHFETGEALVQITQDIPQITTSKIAKPPSLEFDNKRSSRVSTEYPVSPTGYPQPPTPDFPPPSPSTAVIGIQQKINPLDKRKSRNMETITETVFLEKLLLAEKEKKKSEELESCTCVPEPDAIPEEFVKPYDEDGEDIMCVSGDIDTDSLPLPPPSLTDINCSEESEIIDLGHDGSETQDKSPLEPELQPFSGLLRGSVRGRSRKVKSQICDDVIRRPSSGNRRSLNSVLPNITPSMSDKGEMEKGMETFESMRSGSARVDMWPASEEHSFDDSEEWAKIAAIMHSFGAGIARESVFVRDYEADFTKLLAGKTKIQSVGEWLEDMGLGQYENTLVANGYDDMDFLGGNIIEDQDLQEIGIKDEKHRRQIIEAAKSLPKVKPISADNMPVSVEEWLRSLHLMDYYDTFISHKYDRMERVLQLWEVELSTVLDIGTIGHRKRLLASLGEKQVPEMTNRNSRSFVPSTEEKPYYSDIDLFKDYTNLRPSNVMGDEQRKPMSMAAGQSALLSTQFNGRDTDEVRREGKHIQDESVHIRPPHLAQSTSPVKQWCHKPEVLIKGCCNYIAQYLGSAVVRHLNGTDSTREGIAKMKKSTENTARIPSITLSISYKGVKFIDADSRRVVCEHEIGNIFCACQDSEHLNFFAYITKDKELDKHYCHVFCVRSTDLARNIILTLGQAFEIAYQMALKEKAEEEALEFERKLSLGKDDYSHGSSASHEPQSFA